MHEYRADFYGHEMRAVVLGYIRPELDYTSRGNWFVLSAVTWANHLAKDALIKDIETDKRVGLRSLDRGAYRVFANDSFFKTN
jgi:riboflavin kinase